MPYIRKSKRIRKTTPMQSINDSLQIEVGLLSVMALTLMIVIVKKVIKLKVK